MYHRCLHATAIARHLATLQLIRGSGLSALGLGLALNAILPAHIQSNLSLCLGDPLGEAFGEGLGLGPGRRGGVVTLDGVVILAGVVTLDASAPSGAASSASELALCCFIMGSVYSVISLQRSLIRH